MDLRATQGASPSTRFVDAGTLGMSSVGRYSSANGGEILLDGRLRYDPTGLERVWTEALGHHVDVASRPDEATQGVQAAKNPEGAASNLGLRPGFNVNDDGSVTITIEEGPGYHEFTVGPEQGWPDAFEGALWGAGVGALAAGPAAVTGGLLGAAGGLGPNVDVEHEWHAPDWMTWVADLFTGLPRAPVTTIVYPQKPVDGQSTSTPEPMTVNGAGLGEWGGARDPDGKPVNSLAAAAEADFDNAQTTTERPSRPSPYNPSSGDDWSGDGGAGQNSNSDTDGIGP